MNVVKDSVHGNVHFSDFELSLLDTQPMQRLRRLKQVGMSDLIYPGANHTRFEHSIGTMHLAGEMAESAEVKGEEEKLLRAAALLHDVGHGAFSHESEWILQQHIGKGHEELGWEKVKSGEIADAVKKGGFSLPELKNIFFGKGVGELITFDLGADRMDYLLRDSHYTGVAYGVIDYGRLIHTIRMNGKGEAVVEHGGLEAAESMLIARFLMFSSVYYHHAVRIASAMLRKACETAISDKTIAARQIAEMNDEELLLALSANGRAGKLVKRLRERKLLKRAVEMSAYELSPELKAKLNDGKFVEKLEKEVAEGAKASPDELIVDFAPQYNKQETKVRVSRRGSEVPLREISEIVRAAEQAEQGRRKLIVACVPEKKEEVGKAARKIIEALRD